MAGKVWLVSDPDAAGRMVAELGVLPYKNAPESTKGELPAPAHCQRVRFFDQPLTAWYWAAQPSTKAMRTCSQLASDWSALYWFRAATRVAR